MGNLNQLKTGAEVKAQGDSLGGYNAIESGLYNMAVEMAYIDLSAGGAMGLHITFRNNSDNLRQTLWVTSGDTKGNKPTYTDKDGNEQFLPGMNIANALCELTCGKELSDMETEEKVIKVYDFEAKAEINKPKDVILELLGKKIGLGVLKQVVDKNIKDDNGSWVASGETREENEIDKFFDADSGMTIAELKSGATEAEFVHKWAAKNKGVTKMKAKGGKSSPAASGGAGRPAAAATPSLFTD